MKIGRIIFTDTARSAEHHKNLSNETERVISSIFTEPSTYVTLAVANERDAIRAAIVKLCDSEKCPLVLTFGGTGPALADIVPDVTMDAVDRKLPGFGEVMRYYSYERFKVSVLSRAEAGIRGKSLVVNLPSRPKAVKFCLRLLQEGIAEALEQVAGLTPGLRGDEVVLPIDKYLPFLRKIRPKPTPGGENHPSL